MICACPQAGDATEQPPSTRIAVYFVVAGQVADFRAVEAHAGSAVIQEMPVHISELFLAPS